MDDRPAVLIVDDDRAVASMLAATLERGSFEPSLANSVDQAVELLSRAPFDAVLSDVRMPGRSGVDLLAEVRRLRPEIPVLLITGFGSIDGAVEAMRGGACDYITKPFRRREVLFKLQRALSRGRPTSASGGTRSPLLGSSSAMRELRARIERIADRESNVLVTGESGTGKELTAREIHGRSRRAARAFVAVNCAAIPHELLETELFGHVRGAFTGAVSAKTGLFEQAHGGTLFLDEVGDMSLDLQAKLLRVLEDGVVRPVGGIRSVRVDVRVIAATHRDLHRAIDDGRFRQDLFYRLNVIPIGLPPLRERPEDVPELALHFARERSGGRPVSIAPEALERLSRAPWPGNVRELENIIERALALGDGERIGAEEVQSGGVASAVQSEPFVREIVRRGMPLRELEDRVIEEALRAAGGNKVRAAKMLGISRRTLYRRGPGTRSPG